jgi:hypothetical protein
MVGVLVVAATAVGQVVAPVSGLTAGWSSLRFEGHKMGLDGSLTVLLNHGALSSSLAGASGLPEVAVDPSPDELLLERATVLPGRAFFATERITATTAAARVVTSTETGAKNHRKTWTMTPHGFLLDIREPASRSEIELGPTGWTRQGRTFTAFPPDLPPGAPVLGPAGLLYRLSSACLAKPGDSIVLHVLVQAEIEEVTISVLGNERVPLQFLIVQGGETSVYRGSLDVTRLSLRGQSLDPGAEGALKLFGLESDIEMLWDRDLGVPVGISGHVRLLGRLEMQLVSATFD